MKILVIWRLLTVGGVNAGWRNRAVYLKKHGITTEFLYNKDLGGMHIMEDVAPVYLTKDREEIVRIITENNYDLIIVIDTAKAYKWIRKAGFKGPVIVEARTPEIKKLQRNLEGYQSSSPERVIVPSEHQKRVVSLLVNDTPINVVYNGIDISYFKPLLAEEINHSEDPVLEPDKKVVAYVGRLDKRKNWRMLLEIAKRLKENRDDIQIWVIGGENSVEREEFALALNNEHLKDIVKWYPVIPYQQMRHMYAKIKESRGCTIATTRAESFGNTFIESMAAGVPVVAPSISSIPEIVKHGEMGYLFKEDNVDDAIAQIENVVNLNEEAYHSISRQGWKQVEENFSIDVVTDQYAQLIKQIINGGDTPWNH
mgnify:CR=1 FL=1